MTSEANSKKFLYNGYAQANTVAKH